MALPAATMSVAPFAQGPLIPLIKAQSFPGTTVYGPVMMADLMQYPVLAAHMPQKQSMSMDSCVQVSMEGPDECNDQATWTYESVNEDCIIVIDTCDSWQKRTNTDDEDYGTDSGDEHGDSAMEHEDDPEGVDYKDTWEAGTWSFSKEDDFMDSSSRDDFEESKEDESEYAKEDDFEASEEHDFEASKDDSFMDSKEDDSMGSQEEDFDESMGSKDDDFEDSEEHDFEESQDDDFEDSEEHDFEDSKDDDFEAAEEYDFEDTEDVHSEDQKDDFTNSEPTFDHAIPKPFDEGHGDLFPVTKAFKVARQLASGIPQSVQDALISDPNAPRSLAQEFSDGGVHPDWYNNLPESQQQMFLTGRAPQTGTTTMTMTTTGATTATITTSGQTITTTMTTLGATTTTATTTTATPTSTDFSGYRNYGNFSCDNPNDNVTQSCIELAVSSMVADHYSSIATDMSSAGVTLTCPQLLSAASTISQDASSNSAVVSAARSSLNCTQVEQSAGGSAEKIAGINGASSAVLVPKSPVVFAVSFTVAVATLGLALWL